MHAIDGTAHRPRLRLMEACTERSRHGASLSANVYGISGATLAKKRFSALLFKNVTHADRSPLGLFCKPTKPGRTTHHGACPLRQGTAACFRSQELSRSGQHSNNAQDLPCLHIVQHNQCDEPRGTKRCVDFVVPQAR